MKLKGKKKKTFRNSLKILLKSLFKFFFNLFFKIVFSSLLFVFAEGLQGSQLVLLRRAGSSNLEGELASCTVLEACYVIVSIHRIILYIINII